MLIKRNLKVMNEILGSVQVHVNFSNLCGVDNEYQVMCFVGRKE